MSARGTGAWAGPLALLGSALIWGFVPVATRNVVGTLAPGQILLTRFIVGAAAALVAILVLRAPLPRRELLPRAVLFGLLGQLGFNVPLAYGIRYVEAGTTSLISATSPVFIALLAALVLRERIPARVTAGLALALAGTVIVAVMSDGGVSFTRDQLLGSALILCSSILWGFYSVYVKPWLGRIPPTSIPMLGSLAGLPLMLPLGIAGYGSALGALDADGWLSVVQFAFFASVVAPILWAVGLGRGQASRAGLYLYLVPIFGIVASVVLLREPVTTGTVVGGALVLAGVALATLVPARRPRPAVAAGEA